MNIRSFEPKDFEELRRIHEKYFEKEFDLPDFLRNHYCAFVVEDSNNAPVVIGGVRPIAEVITCTNKDLPVRVRRKALNEVLQMSLYAAARAGHYQIHCFIQDEQWYKHLQGVGFRPTVGKPLVMDI